MTGKFFSLNWTFILTLLTLFLFGATTITAAPGDLDPTFGVGGKVIDGSGGGSYDVAIQPDGKIVAVGLALGGSEVTQIAVARYNIDGSPDTTFGAARRVFIDHYQIAVDVAIQPDGKLVVASRNPDGDVYGELFRLNSDGSVDTSFGTNGFVLGAFLPSVAATLPDGKLLISLGAYLYRLNANGSFDMTFAGCTPGGHAINPYSRTESVIQPDGRIVTAFMGGRTSFFGVFRCNADGTLDTSFGSGGIVRTPIGGGNDIGDAQAQSIAIQMDGKIVVTGQSQSNTNSDWQLTVLRYHPNGALDTGFGTGGIVTTPTGISYWIPPQDKVAIQTDGKIVVATTFENGSRDFALVRYNPNGSLDTTFNGTGKVITPITNGNDYAHSLAIQADGKFVVVGAGENGSDFYDLVVRYQGDGARPTSCPNPIDCADFFVRQHYQDFLNREPEPQGFDDWMNVLNSCNGDSNCLYGPNGKRVLVSQSFFGSQEFNLKGGYVFRFYKATLARIPSYAEMVADMASVTGATADEVNQKRAAFASNWVLRADFLNSFPRTLTATEFVDNISQTAGITLANRSQIITDLSANNTDAGRAIALRAIVDSQEEQNHEFNSSFVYMQYVGYLRRDPEPRGYNDWLTYLNAHPGDFNTMVWGFVDSLEYRHRFGP
jgi:uncharacterized delta-60 repeat protein